MLPVGWAVVVGLFGHEYVGSQVTIGATALSLALGGLVAVGLAGWLRRTTSGRGVASRYRHAAFGRRLLVALVVVVPTIAAVFGVLLFVGASTVLAQSAFLGGLLGYWLADATFAAPGTG